METQKRTPWRRWIVLVLMIAGFILGGIFVPVQPEITVAAEKLIEEPIDREFSWLCWSVVFGEYAYRHWQ